MKIQTSKKKKDETKSRMEGEGEKRRCVGVGERGGELVQPPVACMLKKKKEMPFWRPNIPPVHPPSWGSTASASTGTLRRKLKAESVARVTTSRLLLFGADCTFAPGTPHQSRYIVFVVVVVFQSTLNFLFVLLHRFINSSSPFIYLKPFWVPFHFGSVHFFISLFVLFCLFFFLSVSFGCVLLSVLFCFLCCWKTQLK